MTTALIYVRVLHPKLALLLPHTSGRSWLRTRPSQPSVMEGQTSQLVVFGAVAISLIVLIRRLRALEATLADRTAALDAARNQPKAHPPVLSLLASTHTAPAPSLNGHSSRTSQSHRTCEAPPAPFAGTK